ncbi:MAG: hypothetical protein HXS46_15825 [Theionarchaea archaeon]|nr:hypothetical protein [Theionarchaea archaeon]
MEAYSMLFGRRVEDMRTSLEQRRKQYWIIYQLLHQDPRMYIKDISSALGADPAVTSRRLTEALEEGYIVGPQLRKRSHKNTKEYTYFVTCEDPRTQFLKYKKDKNVVYHAVLIGSPNLWVISKEKMDITEDILIEGYRSDYHVPFVPNRSWETAIKTMQPKIETFDSDTYTPNKTIKARWDQYIEWDDQDEILFREFKYDLRKKLTPIMKKHHISGEKLYQWLDKLPQSCTTATYYFPETVAAYDPYFFIMETGYEDFIIDLFSELPTSSFFFKVSDHLCLYTYLKREFLRYAGIETNHFYKLHINLLLMDLLERGIISSEVHTIVEYYWGKDL